MQKVVADPQDEHTCESHVRHDAEHVSLTHAFMWDMMYRFCAYRRRDDVEWNEEMKCFPLWQRDACKCAYVVTFVELGAISIYGERLCLCVCVYMYIHTCTCEFGVWELAFHPLKLSWAFHDSASATFSASFSLTGTQTTAFLENKPPIPGKHFECISIRSEEALNLQGRGILIDIQP